MITRIEPKDIVAFAVIIAVVIFKVTGHNGSLDVALAIIIGYYFARREDTQISIPAALLTPKGDQTLSTPVQITETKQPEPLK